MNEAENKTAKDLLDESIDSIKAKKAESNLEGLDSLKAEIENRTKELDESATPSSENEYNSYDIDNDDDEEEEDFDEEGKDDDCDDDESDENNEDSDSNNESEETINKSDLKVRKPPTKKLTALAILLSAFVPGLGSFYAKNSKRANIFFGLSCAYVIIIMIITNLWVVKEDFEKFLLFIPLFIIYFWSIADARIQANKFNKRNNFSKSTIDDSLKEYPLFEKIFIVFFRTIYWICKIFISACYWICKIFISACVITIEACCAIVGFILGIFWESFKSDYRCPKCHSDWSLQVVQEYDCGSYKQRHYECKKCGYQVTRNSRI